MTYFYKNIMIIWKTLILKLNKSYDNINNINLSNNDNNENNNLENKIYLNGYLKEENKILKITNK